MFANWKVHELADIVKISDGSDFTILHEHLGMRKLCAKWMPRELTCTVSQIDENDGKIEWIGLRIAYPSTIFSRFRPQATFSCFQILRECLLERNLSPMMK